jgi:general secretion pathway protein K
MTSRSRAIISNVTSNQTQRGAALLLAMIIMALITTVAAGMVWQQSRAVQVEGAERARSQAGWILTGALDWSRLILREDLRAAQQRNGMYTALGDTWATPLDEARLSSFLAADKNNNADSGPEAFISGGIVDAQSRLNLRGLIDPNTGKVLPLPLAGLQRLANLVGAPSDAATRLAEALQLALAPFSEGNVGGTPLRPQTVADLVWLGIDKATMDRLAPYIELLPPPPVTAGPTPVNANTASREVLVAAIDNLDVGTAERLVQIRQRKPFVNLDALKAQLPPNAQTGLDATRINVMSSWFEVSGRLRLEERVLEERSLLQRVDNNVVVRRRERNSFTTALR